MCRVMVMINLEGHFCYVFTQYCNNHPACCRLESGWEQIDPIDPFAPVAPPTTTSALGLRTSNFLSNRLSTRGAIRRRAQAAVAAGVGGGGEGSQAGLLRRAISAGSDSLWQGFAKLVGLPDPAAKGPYVPLSDGFCIKSSFVYNCGHPLRLEPSAPVAWACSRAPCNHRRQTHYILVPMNLACTHFKTCNFKNTVHRTELYEFVPGQDKKKKKKKDQDQDEDPDRDAEREQKEPINIRHVQAGRA